MFHFIFCQFNVTLCCFPSPQQRGEASRSCRVRELHQSYEGSGQKSIHDPQESRSRKSGSALKMSIWGLLTSWAETLWPLWVTECLSRPSLEVGNLSRVFHLTSCLLPPTLRITGPGQKTDLKRTRQQLFFLFGTCNIPYYILIFYSIVHALWLLTLAHHQETCLLQWGMERVAGVELPEALGSVDHQWPEKTKMRSF